MCFGVKGFGMDVKGICSNCIWYRQEWCEVETDGQLCKVIDWACGICDVFKRSDGYCDMWEQK